MGTKKDLFSESWKKKEMARRRVRMMMRLSINPLTTLNIFWRGSRERFGCELMPFLRLSALGTEAS
jgi:hypothetical protein